MAVKQSAAPKAPPTAISPVRAALARVAQNFSINLAPFPESEQALAFQADAAEALAKGITSAETHRVALTLLRDGKRLKRATDEHWQKVTRWLEDRKKDIRTILAMDLEHVEPGITGLNSIILKYEDDERQRVARAEAEQRRVQERAAQEKRERELADMEKQALAAEGESDELSDRERAFVQRVCGGIGRQPENPEWLNATAKACGFKQENYGVVLMARPKITAAIEGMRQAQALREQAAAVAEKPIEVTKVEVQSNTAKVAGTRTVTTWTAECVDFDLFIDKFVAGEVDRQTFRDLVMPNSVGGNEKARALHENMDRIPGWRHVKKVTKGA